MMFMLMPITFYHNLIIDTRKTGLKMIIHPPIMKRKIRKIGKAILKNFTKIPSFMDLSYFRTLNIYLRF